MKIFISHPILGEDLAVTLKKILEESDQIKEVFIAQRIKNYNIEISEKIIKQIDSSDCVVAIITKNTQSSASVNQELGYAQGKGIPKIPMIEKNAIKGVFIYGKDIEEFTRENFANVCKIIRKQIIQAGTRNKPHTAEEIFIQKSAHFRYEIKQCLDIILDSVIYQLQVVLEKRDLLWNNNKKRKNLFKEIFEVFDHNFLSVRVKQVPSIEKQLLKLPLSTFRRFNGEFEIFRLDINEAKELPHNDLLPDELDAFQKLNKTISDFEENIFDIKKYLKSYYDEESFSSNDNFLHIIKKHSKNESIPFTNIFRVRMNYLSTLIKSIILLEQEIDKIYDKFGKISLKDRFVE